MSVWRTPTPSELVRSRPLRLLARPFRERHFTFDAYASFVDRLGTSEMRVVPLRELRTAPRDRPVLGLRHDVDERLDNALRLAALEHERGLRATYFVLHTAAYWRSPTLLEDLRRLQELGHEVGWHNDLVSLELVDGVDPVEYLRRELGRLRSAGIDVVGTAAHGSIWCAILGFDNNAFFTDFPEAERPARPIHTASLAEMGLEYEAYDLAEDHYFSDARFDEQGRRWHPDLLDPRLVARGETAIVLVHPCHWDRSVGTKIARLPGRFFAKPGELRLRRRVLRSRAH